MLNKGLVGETKLLFFEMASAKISTPRFDVSSRYEAYEAEVLAWQTVTSLTKEKQAIVLVLAMEEMKEKVLEEITLADLKAETGVTKLLKYLKDNFGKDDLIDCLDRYKNFRDYHRTAGQSIGEYCSGFEQRVVRIKGKGLTLPPEILAFEIIRNARISKEDEKLVMTGLNFAKKETMYTDAIKALKKFLGERSSVVGEGAEPTIKCEPAYATWNRGYNRDYSHRRQKYYDENDVEINPLGRHGKHLTCFCCGSKRHLVEDCPHKECVNNEGQGDSWRGEDDGDWNQQEGEYGYDHWKQQEENDWNWWEEDDGDWNQQEGEYGYDNWNQWRGENEGDWNQQEGEYGFDNWNQWRGENEGGWNQQEGK